MINDDLMMILIMILMTDDNIDADIHDQWCWYDIDEWR